MTHSELYIFFVGVTARLLIMWNAPLDQHSVIWPVM